jgi:ribonuclease HI
MYIKRCGIGCVFDNGDIICEEIDYGTNNDAEYIGLIRALEHAIKSGIDELDVYMDSMLVVKQVNREWKINFPHLLPKYALITKSMDIMLNHILAELL